MCIISISCYNVFMLWLLFPLGAAIFYSLCNFTENFIVDTWCRRVKPQILKIAYLGFDVVFMVAMLIWQGPKLWEGLDLMTILVLLAVGTINALASIPYYSALKKDDTTELTLLEQISPVLALIFGIIFLNQVPSMSQGLAFILIMGGMLLTVLEIGQKAIKIDFKSSSLILIACVLWVMSDVVFVMKADSVDFWPGFFWLMVGGFISNLIMIAMFKSWRDDFKKFWKKDRLKKTMALSGTYIPWVIAEILWRMGVLLVPVAIMSVTGSVMQLIATFILGIFLTLLWPKFGREQLKKKIIVKHAMAMVLIAIGLVLIG